MYEMPNVASRRGRHKAIYVTFYLAKPCFWVATEVRFIEPCLLFKLRKREDEIFKEVVSL